MGDFFPSVRLATIKGSMLGAERKSGFGVKMYTIEENEETEEVSIQALRKVWRRWMAAPESYNWHRTEESWRTAVTTAEKGGEGAVKKILQARTTRFRWAEAPDHDEEDSDTDGANTSDSNSGKEYLSFPASRLKLE